jgi:CheY-like chemotaxis protein
VPPPAAPRVAKADRRATILVVDDDADLASMTCAMLRAFGYAAVSSTNAAMALSIIRDDPFAIDLLISDQTMPGMTGDELAIGAKAIRSDLPIILCTGYSARINESVAKQVGAVALLFKPLSRDELADAVTQALRSSAPSVAHA